MLRRILWAIVLIPLTVAIVAFAVANRQAVTVSFDPLEPALPAYAISTWLFMPIYAALMLGVLVGGLSAWVGQGRWRGAARRFEREVHELRGKIAALEGQPASGSAAARSLPPPLKLRPPAA